ncbi:hypothetical protein [Pseudarthrobacter sp. NPDC058119]
MSRSESLVMLTAFLGVTVLGVLPGIVVAVDLAIRASCGGLGTRTVPNS